MKTVLITGCSSGLGRASALSMTGEGWRVFACVRKEEDGRSLVEECPKGLEPVILDVTDAASIRTVVETVESRLGGQGLDGLVNNAGISVQGPLEFVPVDQFEHVMKVNVTGQLAVTQAFLPLIRKAKGRIVFMSSESGRITFPFVGPYSASKFALEAVANGFRQELLPWGIRVSLIEPAAAKSRIWEKAEKNNSDTFSRYPEKAREYYGKELDLLVKGPTYFEKRAFPAERVSERIVHALTSKRPEIRYPVGFDAKLNLFLYSILPTRFLDWVTWKVMALIGRMI